MSDNLTKALYFGVSLLLFAFAVSAYLSLYGGFQEYRSAASGSGEAYGVAVEKETSPQAVMGGDEVVNLILEKRGNDADSLIQELYGSACGAEEALPDIRIDGMAHSDFDISSVSANDSYSADFTFDRQGNTLIMDLELIR